MMTDYHPLIARAVEGLDRGTGEARRALYERARTALVTQLRECDTLPPTLRLVVTREKGHVNSQFMTSGGTRRVVNRPGVSINPDDAATAGISAGRTVLVESDHGRLVTTACLDERLSRGVVSIPHGYADDNVAQLCGESEIDRVSGMATLTAISVVIRPIVSADVDEEGKARQTRQRSC